MTFPNDGGPKARKRLFEMCASTGAPSAISIANRAYLPPLPTQNPRTTTHLRDAQLPNVLPRIGRNVVANLISGLFR